MENKHNQKTKYINLDSVCNDLKAAISKRLAAQKKQRAIQDALVRTHQDYSEEMSITVKQIKEANHSINYSISLLCQCKTSHRAMNIASEYLENEIKRLTNIINKHKRDIMLVEQGKKAWIEDNGYIHRDNSGMKKYVQSKEQQRERMIKQLNQISKYIVKNSGYANLLYNFFF